MPTLYLRRASLAIGLLAVACTSNKNLEQERPQASTELIEQPVAPTPVPTRQPKAPRLAQLDTAHFSPRFIRSFKEAIRLEGEYDVHGRWLLLSPTDSVAFPATELPANTPVTYAATAQGRDFRLTVVRRNYSTIRYTATVTRAGKTLAQQAGVADLNPSFYLSSEAPEDSQTGTVYGAYEFNTVPARGSRFAILIGVAADADKAQLYVTDASGQLLPTWQNPPTLRRQ